MRACECACAFSRGAKPWGTLFLSSPLTCRLRPAPATRAALPGTFHTGPRDASNPGRGARAPVGSSGRGWVAADCGRRGEKRRRCNGGERGCGGDRGRRRRGRGRGWGRGYRGRQQPPQPAQRGGQRADERGRCALRRAPDAAAGSAASSGSGSSSREEGRSRESGEITPAGAAAGVRRQAACSSRAEGAASSEGEERG